MITTKIDGNTIELRNLQEQVQKNKEDIEYLINEEGALNQFGLKVVGQVETIGDMPTIQDYKTNNPNWEYGDAYMVGVSTEEATVVDVEDATLLVLTRANTVYPNDFWMNLGEFPKPGPQGIQGEQGIQGKQGEQGLSVITGTQLPSIKYPDGTTFINATTGDVYVAVYDGSAWTKYGNIKGPTGSIGATGPQGATGPIGPTGATGPQGPRGIGVNILGTLTSTSQLPDPTTVAKDSAYIIPADGVNHLWVIEGTDNLVWTDFGTAGIGEKGEKGDDGVGIDTMTDLDLTYGDTTVEYNTTDGMSINGQARFTYNGGTTKDVTMDVEIPIVAGDGITVDKVDGQEKVEVKLDTAYTDEKYVPIPTNESGGLIRLIGQYDTTSEGDYEYRRFELNAGDENALIPAYRDDGGDGIWGLDVTTGEEPAIGLPDNDGYTAVNKWYVNKHYVAKIGTSAQVGTILYGRDYNGNEKGYIVESIAHNANSIVQRKTGGAVEVGTPTGVSDATTKAYVDAQTTYTHYITITNENYDGMLLLTFPAKIAEPFEDFTVLADKLANVRKPIMATGYLHNNSATSEPTVTIYGIEFDSTEQLMKALVTYQTATLNDDQTITTTTTSGTITIQEDGYWTITDEIV